MDYTLRIFDHHLFAHYLVVDKQAMASVEDSAQPAVGPGISDVHPDALSSTVAENAACLADAEARCTFISSFTVLYVNGTNLWFLVNASSQPQKLPTVTRAACCHSSINHTVVDIINEIFVINVSHS